MLFVIIAELFIQLFKLTEIKRDRFTTKVKRLFKKFVRNKLGGELVVTGSDAVEIEFECVEPRKVVVYFQDCQEKVPCNPGHTDHLEWVITRRCCHQHVLKISWDVVGTRTIIWRVTC